MVNGACLARDGSQENSSSSLCSALSSCASILIDCDPTFTEDLADRIGVVLAITIPRVPGFSINSTDPIVKATGDFNSSITTEFSRSPANFSFPGVAQLEVDTSSNILPLTFTKLDALVYDLDTSKKVGKGSLGKQTFPANTFSSMQFPLNFTYTATNDSDTTCELSLEYAVYAVADA